MKRVGILYHPMIEAACALAKQLEEFLVSKNFSVWLCSAWEWERAKAQAGGTDLILSIGGDGTLLRAAQTVIPGLTPITGVNLGRLGFMTELSVDETMERLPALLAGEGWIDERSLLETQLSYIDERRELTSIFYSLNDTVLARGEIVRAINIEARIDGELLATYKADGVIIATATGSTAYSLAVGGPILHPRAKEFLLLPISPHLCAPHAMVLPSTAVVGLRLSATYTATLSIDGHINLPVPSGATLTVRRSSNTVRFLRIHPDTFYSSLEQRLKGRQ